MDMDIETTAKPVLTRESAHHMFGALFQNTRTRQIHFVLFSEREPGSAAAADAEYSRARVWDAPRDFYFRAMYGVSYPTPEKAKAEIAALNAGGKAPLPQDALFLDFPTALSWNTVENFPIERITISALTEDNVRQAFSSAAPEPLPPRPGTHAASAAEQRLARNKSRYGAKPK